MDGILLLDKPAGRTSHDMVAEARRASRQREVGHAGTLDPMATGLLVLLMGRACRLAEFLEVHDKEYDASVRLGVSTDTDDAEGRILERRAVGVSDGEVREAAGRLTGEFDQRPPAFSAVKQGGEALYRKARRGERVDAVPRRVRVDEFSLVGREGDTVRFRIRCGKGTYVRSLARDLGAALGCGGHVSALRRTASGPFRVEDASPLEPPLDPLPMDAGLVSLPEVRLATGDERRFVQGMAVEVRPAGPLVRVYCGSVFLGVGASREGKLAPRKVIVSRERLEERPWLPA